jgi:hypothetical protein
LADTTVYRTIKACGLATAKRWYTDAEVARFEQARMLFKLGHSAKEVAAFFAMKAIAPVADTPPNHDSQGGQHE